MNRIIKIGMDVHSTSFSICAVEPFLESSVRELMTTKVGVNCVVLAPSTMASPKGKRIKTGTREAYMIAKCFG